MERGFSGLAMFGVAAIAWNLGWNLGIALEKHEQNAEGRVHEVQLYNEQLREQLQPGHKLIAQLVLKDSAKTYSFDTVTADEQPETCQGSYQVKNKHATITGDLACTTTVSVR